LAFKESNGKIIAATENGVFYYDTVSGEITKLSKANGLHEVKFLHLIIILIPSCINWL
jgi:ligand-binding sensor domain-containing protein